MAVTIKVHGVPATIDRGVWQSSDPILVALLRVTMPDVQGYLPDPDLWRASKAVERFGGVVVSKPSPERIDPDRVQ